METFGSNGTGYVESMCGHGGTIVNILRHVRPIVGGLNSYTLNVKASEYSQMS